MDRVWEQGLIHGSPGLDGQSALSADRSERFVFPTDYAIIPPVLPATPGKATLYPCAEETVGLSALLCLLAG